MNPFSAAADMDIASQHKSFCLASSPSSNPSSLISNITNQSTIFKRHEKRRLAHSSTNHGKKTSSKKFVDESLSDTIKNLTRRSTVYKNHQLHHEAMKHNPHTNDRHMNPSKCTHYNGIIDTLSSMSHESTLYFRNLRRHEFFASTSNNYC